MLTDPSSNLANETGILREVYAALNRNDIPTIFTFFDPQIERIEPAEFPATGIYRGHEEVKEHFSKGRDSWAEGGCEPEEFIVAGDRIIVFVHVRVKLKKTMEWVEGDATDIFTFRNGKIIEMRTFFERPQALEWAGVKAS